MHQHLGTHCAEPGLESIDPAAEVILNLGQAANVMVFVVSMVSISIVHGKSVSALITEAGSKSDRIITRITGK